MHTGTQRKMSAEADGCPAREQGKIALPYSTAHGYPEEKCQQKLTVPG